MNFANVFVAVIGGLLLLGSIRLVIYVMSQGTKVKSWKPFMLGNE